MKTDIDLMKAVLGGAKFVHLQMCAYFNLQPSFLPDFSFEVIGKGAAPFHATAGVYIWVFGRWHMR